jgi:hypothetical protein
MDALLRALTFERRRVALIGAAAGAAALAGVAALVLATRAPSGAAACTGLDAPLAGVWDATVAAQLEQRFLASGQPQAAQRFALVRRTLDRYAADWRAEREDACGDSRVRRDQTEAELALRNGCLDERLAELGALTRALAGADAAAVDRAPEAARGLGRIATCGKPLQLGAVSPPDPAIAAEVLAVREELDRAQVRAALDGLAEGEPLLAAARARAEQLDYGPLLAEVHLATALVAWAREDYPATIREAREAMMIAERVRWDEVKVRAAQALARALIETGELAEAERVAELADATIARLGGDAALESTQRLNRGILLVRSKRAAEAVPLLERELAAREQAGDDPLGAATVMLELQIAYTNVSRHADAEAMIARHEPIMDAYYGASSEAQLQRIVGRSMRAAQRGDIAGAIELTDRAHQLMTSLRAPDDIDLAHSEMGQAINYLLIEDWAHMRDHARAAAARYEQLNRPRQAASMLEYVCWGALELGEHAAAIADCRRGVALAASERNPAAAEQLLYSRYQLAKALVAIGGADEDAEALAVLDDVMPRLEQLAGTTRQVLGSIRFLQAQALWRRNRGGDRERARALAVQARADQVAHRDQFDPADGLGALYHRSSNRLIGRIDDWRAARER